MNQKIKNKLILFLGFSVSVHIVVFSIVYLFPLLKKNGFEEKIEVVLIQAPSEENIQNIPTPKPTVKIKKFQQQIVQTEEEIANNKIDQNTRFLSAKNNFVEKETIAKNVGQFKNADAQLAKEIEKEFKDSQKSSKSKLFDTGFNVYERMNQREDFKKQAQKEKANKNSKNTGDSATNDHIENKDTSLKTQLNTREYLYYGYHKRIRTQLDQWYESKLRQQIKLALSKGRNLAAVENKRTQLLIVLNDRGDLVKVQVLGLSGVRELDDAAIETFKKAAPFPNPPKGMVDPDGTIKVRWDFVLS